MNKYKEARDTLKGLQMAEAVLIRVRNKKCDWDDPSDRLTYLAELRRKDRNAVLDRFVPDRICPICCILRVSSRSWVILENRVICRSCYQREQPENDKMETIKRKIFNGPQVRYEVDGFELSSVRTIAGISKSEFARRAGWSPAYQNKLESFSNVSVTKEKAELILNILNEFKIQTEDCI